MLVNGPATCDGSVFSDAKAPGVSSDENVGRPQDLLDIEAPANE
jgi:hypothetical protein